MIMDSGTKQLLACSLTMMLLPLPSWAQLHATISPALPNLNTGDAAQAGDKSPTSAEAMYCRPPQDVTGSRLKGPKVCLTVGKWKELHAQGLDVSADGSSIVPLLQKQMEAAPGLSGLP
jgi:hypothetical protein